ncbi:hypothetical protein chiPu_0028343 [Chiloscyllium punctatum]|uniref:Uncharacterized protein n=1 Tax=Chiloscyllium punctatum TaxID=137246 RepID=A0A401TNH3_CHIPU|nr:hypothetical protein [Chiloscyllium punctatum]
MRAARCSKGAQRGRSCDRRAPLSLRTRALRAPENRTTPFTLPAQKTSAPGEMAGTSGRPFTPPSTFNDVTSVPALLKRHSHFSLTFFKYPISFTHSRFSKKVLLVPQRLDRFRPRYLTRLRVILFKVAQCQFTSTHQNQVTLTNLHPSSQHIHRE